ncbi:uncharacterized protein LOC135843437 [Planococcus citri]|uniref:uncharacterized protein LOC135843437 n=1 Tax=Planococcus citri TaxID=170843 RepID=UPI0031F97E38
MANPDGDNFQDAVGPVVARINVKCPPFWRADPTLWFVQVEAQFANAGISADLTKYNTIIAALEHDVMSKITDIVLSPPNQNKYDNLKNKMIKRFSDSGDKKVSILLNEIILGDQKPSSLFRKMKQLADGQATDNFLKGLWLKKLPENVHTVLVSRNDGIDDLLEAADKMVEIPRNYINAVSSSSSTSTLEQKVELLTQQVGILLKRDQDRSRSHSRSRNSSNSRENRNRNRSRNYYSKNVRNREPTPAKNKDFCWYHDKFGKKAKKCIPPCKYESSEN